jgi:hypothetical protein
MPNIIILTGLIREYLEDLVRKEDIQRESAAADLEGLFARSRAAVGPKTWTRDDLHARNHDGITVADPFRRG